MSGGFAMRRAIALLFFAIFCLPAQGLPPEVLTLARIRGRVRQTLDKLPDCTCIETVDRFRKPAGKELQPFDRVVLEILFSGDKELFTVPGDTRWEANPSAFLASGMMGNGIFATQLQSIFLNNVSVIAYKGDGSPAGRREARYDFSISRLSSGYTVHHEGASGVVALRGSFRADPETYDLRRVEFHADEIPPELLYTDIATTIDYDRVRIGQSDVLLPRAADLRTTGVDGEEKWNHIEFTHCQGFHTESTLSFGAGDATPSAGPAWMPARPTEGTLPPGLRITVALSAPLDDRNPAGSLLAVGSLIQGRVVGNVVRKGKVLVPSGALVNGRIRRLESHSDAGAAVTLYDRHDRVEGDYFIVALEFVRIEMPSVTLWFYAELQDVERPAVQMLINTAHAEWQAGPPSLKAGLWMSETERVRISTHEVPGVGTFFVRGAHLSLPSGFKTVWTTQLYPRSERR